MKVANLFFVLISGVPGLLCSSCSSQPNLADLESSLRKEISVESDGRIELLELKETNMVEKDALGQEVYSIEYEAKIRFKSDCYMYYNKSGSGPVFTSFKTYQEQPEFVPSLQMQVGFCEKNQEFKYSGVANYIKSDDNDFVLLNE